MGSTFSWVYPPTVSIGYDGTPFATFYVGTIQTARWEINLQNIMLQVFQEANGPDAILLSNHSAT